ncbi:MAG TPA: hypothetical protein VHP83_14595 [Aggregatilineaceae bacterium]|nr:hypothetical protein [Aggregatilineaceae bacterium]
MAASTKSKKTPLFTGYLKLQTSRSPEECLLALRENQGRPGMFGGIIRVVLPPNQPLHFEIEYYHRHQKSGRPTYVAQRLQGVLYTETGQTHLAAKLFFTNRALMWVWVALALSIIPLVLAVVTGNVMLLMVLILTAPFLLAMLAVLGMDRYSLRRYVRRCMGV